MTEVPDKDMWVILRSSTLINYSEEWKLLMTLYLQDTVQKKKRSVTLN